MITSLIHKIKEQKNFNNFWQVPIDEIEKKMSKIIITKKQILKQGILEQKIFHICIFLKDLLEISRIRW